MNKPKLNKYLSFSISNDKSLLEILDSVEETNGDIRDIRDIRETKDAKNIKKCKCCDKYIVKFLEEHQAKCFQNKILSMTKTIEESTTKMKLLKENIKHDIKIKGMEFLIQRNEEKWNKIYKL